MTNSSSFVGRWSGRAQELGRALARSGVRSGRAAALACVLALGASSGCGTPDNLVLVNVSGLESAITELRVSLTIDGAAARNPMPSTDNPDTTSFAVYKDMRRFGVEVPAGTKQLGISVEGLNTARVAVKTGSTTVDSTQRHDASIALAK